MQGPNVWPEEWEGQGAEDGSKEALVAFFFEMVRVARAVCRLLSLALGQPEDYLTRMCGKGGDVISLMRAFHYLPLSSLPPSVDPSTALGSSPHTDWGFLTLIYPEAGRGGLQALDTRTQTWREITPPPGRLVVNCGDYLSLLSRGAAGSAIFHSPVHRVMLSPTDHRTSMVFFYYPSFDARLPGAIEKPGGDASAVSSSANGYGVPYNTLLDAEGAGDALATFGEHLTRKWASVRRGAPPET